MHVKALADPISCRVKDVFLDGKSVRNIAFEADDEEGWVDVFEHQYIDGKLVLREGSKRMSGKVEIVFDEKPPEST